MAHRPASKEIPFSAISGWLPVIFLFLFIPSWFGTFGRGAYLGWHEGWVVPAMLLGVVVVVLTLPGFFIVNPNMSRVLVLFGKYRGTVREAGFFWTNPFTSKGKFSLRAHNLASETIKVNDLVGNPIEIGTVVVWKVEETAQAAFDVEDYRHYVDVQIESAVRHLAKAHPYDENASETDVPSLRGDTDEVTVELQAELQARLERAGIDVLEARISHLAYAPEIASAMLQRQQASAIVAAREKIVEGAVSMVEQALEDLSSKHIVELDDERRATMVGNLLVVLCGQAPATPIVNTGTLYS